MTLQNLLTKISQLAINQELVNCAQAGTDIYNLNVGTIEAYPVLFSSPTGSHRVGENTTVYTITVYYIDRLLSDSSNDLDIISIGIEQLKNLIRGIEEIEGVVNVEREYNIVSFTETERLSDKCAGDYATIEVEVLNDFICFEE